MENTHTDVYTDGVEGLLDVNFHLCLVNYAPLDLY